MSEPGNISLPSAVHFLYPLLMAYKIKKLLLDGREAFDPKIARGVGERADCKES
jgi:hypothetical protein